MSAQEFKVGDTVRMKANPNEGDPVWVIKDISASIVFINPDGNSVELRLPLDMLVRCDPVTEKRNRDIKTQALIDTQRNLPSGA